MGACCYCLQKRCHGPDGPLIDATPPTQSTAWVRTKVCSPADWAIGPKLDFALAVRTPARHLQRCQIQKRDAHTHGAKFEN
eukprot:2178073-Amphidinium_carterae.1